MGRTSEAAEHHVRGHGGSEDGLLRELQQLSTAERVRGWGGGLRAGYLGGPSALCKGGSLEVRQCCVPLSTLPLLAV